MSDRPLLAIIPVRGQSKRIPRKWAADVNGKPLLQHTIDTARAASVITRLVVSSEDPTIQAYARLRGVEVIDRPAELADDTATIADVVRHVVEATGWEHDIVVLQPTCPLLRPETVDRVVADWRHGGADWAITASPERHLYWHYGKPLTPRLNSQELADEGFGPWRESGATQLFTDRAAQGDVRRGTIIPIDSAEALDIDTHADLAAARQALGRRTILFHVVASDEKGSGHLRRCLQLSDALGHHDVWWDQTGLEGWAIAVAEQHGVRWAEAPDSPDLAVIDCLDGADRLAPLYASHGVPTVVFEPDGAVRAGRFADLVLDEFSDPHLSVLRPEFLCLPPYEVRERADHVLVSFGGTDPTGMNERVRRLLNHGADATVSVAHAGRQVSMAERMCWADLVVTSQGRTVHEAAAVGVPCLSIAVNERESRHARLPGVVYLGLAHTLSDAAILDAVNRLLGSYTLRVEMSTTSSRVIDGRGLSRVTRMIEGLLCD